MFGLPQSTLRYYDKEGLLPHIQRQGAGIRRWIWGLLPISRGWSCFSGGGPRSVSYTHLPDAGGLEKELQRQSGSRKYVQPQHISG